MHSPANVLVTVPDHKTLKEKHRAVRDNFPQPLSLRIHRSLSWLGRAEREADDADVRFILSWIGFNAAYSADLDQAVTCERNAFQSYFKALVSLDRDNRIYNAVWNRFSQEIRLLLDNRYVYAPFWKYQNGVAGYEDWEERLRRSMQMIGRALHRRDTPLILSILFDRLYVLRNQLVHGGATWKSQVNRNQVRDGAAVLDCLLTIFIDIMMDNPHHDWGRPYVPVVKA